jgi:DNA repair ATPase RecN
MKKYLKKLRERTDEEKKYIVRTSALITTGIIFIIYLLILAFLPQGPSPVESTQQDALNAFSDVLGGGIDQLGGIGNQIQEQSDQLDIRPENLQLLEEQFEQESNLENNPQEDIIDSPQQQNTTEIETESLDNQQTN